MGQYCHLSYVLLNNVNLQFGRDWRDLDSLFIRNYGIVLPRLGVSISGPVCSPFLLSVNGVILNRYLTISKFPTYCSLSPYFDRKAWYLIMNLKNNSQYVLLFLSSSLFLLSAVYNVQRSIARRAWLIVQRIEGFYKAASFANLLVFLYTGR